MKRLFLLSLLLLAFALRLHQIDAFSFWQDEGLTPLRAAYSLGTILSGEVTIQEGVTQDTHPPLYFLLIHFTRLLFGESDFAYRFPSVLAGLLLVPLLFQFGRAVAGDKVGLIAALLATLNPLFIWFSQEARMYTMLILFATAASYALWRGLTSTKILRWLLIYMLFAALAFLTHYTAALLIVFQALFWVWLLWNRGHRWLIAGAALLGLLVLIPFIPYTVPRIFTGAETNYFYVSPFIMLQDVVHGFGMGSTAQFSQLFIRLLDLFMAVILLFGIYGAYRLSDNWLLPTYLLVYLLAAVLGLALGSLIKPMYQGVRHIIVGSSAFILLLSLGVNSLPSGRQVLTSPRHRWLRYAALALLLIGSLISLNGLYNNDRYAKDDVRALIFYIEEHAGDSDIVLYNNAILLGLHEHYSERDDLPAAALPTYPFPANDSTIVDLEAIAAGHDRIWFVNDPPADGRDDGQRVADFLSSRFLLIDREKKHARTIKVEVETYSTGDVFTEALPPGVSPIEGSNGSENQLAGWSANFDQPAAVPNLWLDLHFSNPTPAISSEQLRFFLRDQDGQVWLERNRPLWTWNQELNDYFMQHLDPELDSELDFMRLSYDLKVPAGTPPGEYDLSLLSWDKAGEKSIGEAVTLGTIKLGPTDDWPLIPADQYDTAGSLKFGSGITLEGLSNLEAEVRPGHSMPIFLYWSASDPTEGLSYELQLVGPRGEVWDDYTSNPGPNWLPVSDWTSSTVREIVGLSFPADSPPGGYHLRWRLLADGDPVPGRPSWRPWSTEWVNFGQIDLHPWPLVTEAPNADNIVNVEFGADIALYGYDLDTNEVEPGDVVDLSLYWQALNQPASDLLTFVHLISPEDGTIVSQIDRVPAEWLRPTAGWRSGEYVSDHYTLFVPEDLPSGEYFLYTGFFDPESFIRPPVFLGGERLPDDRYQLPTITVNGSD